ncbi:MAG: YitT family protein [Clostridiales bacterium]|nr:YitT family protein [Clostridiales bacterium]
MNIKKCKHFIKILKICAYYALTILLSGFLRAVGIFIFVTPNKFAPGGINGVSVLMEYITGWSSGWFLLMLNIPLFFVAFFCIGKREAIVSTLSMLLTSGLLIVFDNNPWLCANLQYQANNGAILAAITGGIFLGVALAIMLKSCGTAGGTAVLASLVNKKWRFLNISWLTSAFDALVVFISFFVYNQGMSFTDKLNPVLLALVSLFATSKVCDLILQGFKVAYRFEIITNKPEEIASEIMERTHHAVTEMSGIGMYSHKDYNVLVCIIRKRHIADIQRIIKKYPDTFASFTPVSEVYGKFLK